MLFHTIQFLVKFLFGMYNLLSFGHFIIYPQILAVFKQVRTLIFFPQIESGWNQIEYCVNEHTLLYIKNIAI